MFKGLINRIRFETFEIVQFIFKNVPGSIGYFVRKVTYKMFFLNFGSQVIIGQNCRIQCPQNIFIGNNSGLNDFAWIAANIDKNGGIRIGENVLIGPHVIIHSGNHNFSDLNIPIKNQGYTFNEVIIEDNVWIGARCTILSGVKVASGSVIAAGSVLTKSTIANGVYAGIPAKLIKVRNL